MHSFPRLGFHLPPRGGVCAALALAVFAAAGASARAELGGAYATVEADRAHLHASLRAVSTGLATVHHIALTSGGEVREFTRPDGVVFAVAWSGPARPDLRQLLGARFEVLQADNPPPRIHKGRRPPRVSRSDFVLRSGGHSGAFFGFAYLPNEIPAGFSASEIH